MSRATQQIWSIVALEIVIIILLLMRFGDRTLRVVTPGTSSYGGWPNYDAATYQINTVGPAGYPFYLQLPPAIPGQTFDFQGTNPCACGCSGPSQTEQLANLTGDFNSLNANIQNATIKNTMAWFAAVPGYLTNATPIAGYQP